MNAISSPSLQLKSYYQIFINTVQPPFRLYKSCPFEDDVCSLHTVLPLPEPHSISRVTGVTEANSVSSKITFRPPFPFLQFLILGCGGGSWMGWGRRMKAEDLNVMFFLLVTRHSWSFSIISSWFTDDFWVSLFFPEVKHTVSLSLPLLSCFLYTKKCFSL